MARATAKRTSITTTLNVRLTIKARSFREDVDAKRRNLLFLSELGRSRLEFASRKVRPYLTPFSDLEQLRYSGFSPLDTLVSGQLNLGPSLKKTVFLNSHTNSVFLRTDTNRFDRTKIHFTSNV